jgi:hypothetical protein
MTYVKLMFYESTCSGVSKISYGFLVHGLRPYFSTPTVITFGVSFELLLFLTSNVKFFEC